MLRHSQVKIVISMKRHLSVLEQYIAVALCVRVYRWFLVPEVLSGDGTDPSGSKQGKVFQKFVTLL